jgi:aspartyl-tRNA(Asn)/glutamyl-tRNA(Gln) amidotransferase subunit C
MAVDEGDVFKIARLARIAVKQDDVATLQGELNQILDWVEQLDEVNTDSVEPMTCVVAADMKMREDIVNDGDKAADIVKNAPDTQDHYFVVPKVIE